MNVLVVLIPISLFLGLLGLIGFLWTIRSHQYEDPVGEASRILLEGDAGVRGDLHGGAQAFDLKGDAGQKSIVYSRERNGRDDRGPLGADRQKIQV